MLELTELFGLEEKRDEKVLTLSKGMQQRLSLAVALIRGPSVLFLDEPLLGLDVQGAPLIKERVPPLHAHRDTEEVSLILQARGEAWMDGETAPFEAGYAVLFPATSKHMVRNTGDESLITASISSAPTTPDSYMLFVHEGW